MLLEAKGGNLPGLFGYSKAPFILYEEHRPGLPEECDLPNGWRCLRTGSVTGGTSRHPAEDWLSNRSLGPGRTVELAAIFVYDPKAGKVTVERVSKSDEYFRERERIQKEGWLPVPSGLDRVVGYRAFNPNK